MEASDEEEGPDEETRSAADIKEEISSVEATQLNKKDLPHPPRNFTCLGGAQWKKRVALRKSQRPALHEAPRRSPTLRTRTRKKTRRRVAFSCTGMYYDFE
jgi:hypothetical protein